jgi:hypothetical protein
VGPAGFVLEVGSVGVLVGSWTGSSGAWLLSPSSRPIYSSDWVIGVSRTGGVRKLYFGPRRSSITCCVSSKILPSSSIRCTGVADSSPVLSSSLTLSLTNAFPHTVRMPYITGSAHLPTDHKSKK